MALLVPAIYISAKILQDTYLKILDISDNLDNKVLSLRYVQRNVIAGIGVQAHTYYNGL